MEKGQFIPPTFFFHSLYNPNINAYVWGNNLKEEIQITEETYLIWQSEWDMMFSSLEYVTGGSRSLSLVIKRDAIVSSVFMPHSLHIQPPALSVELIDSRTFHLTLNTGGDQPLHLLLHHTYTPVSDGKIQRVHRWQMRS